MMKTLSIAEMVDKLDTLRETNDLNTWEKSLVRNCVNTIGPKKVTNHLSGPQVEKIEQLFKKHF